LRDCCRKPRYVSLVSAFLEYNDFLTSTRTIGEFFNDLARIEIKQEPNRSVT
jgi:hypothetical protein